jgi:geranylgeranyl diphosphate synthase type II
LKELDEYKVLIDQSLMEYMDNLGDGKLARAMAYSVEQGGKRIRPVMALVAGEMFGGSLEEAMPLAMAIEMIHTYSLIHDDLPAMDNDDLRRGKPTNHKVFGEAMAILAGDALLNEAHTLLIRSAVRSGVRGAEAALTVSLASGSAGMVEGQVRDLENEGRIASYDELKGCHELKTGMLIAASLEAPAVLFGASDDERKAMRELGLKLGLAFQIKDDILDRTSTKEVLGKTPGKDETSGKTTYVSLFGLEKSEEMAKGLTDECLGILKGLDRDTAQLWEMCLALLQRNH